MTGRDAKQSCRAWRGAADEPLELAVKRGDLLVEGLDAPRERTQRKAGRLRRALKFAEHRPQPAAATRLGAQRLVLGELRAQRLGSSDDQVIELRQRGAAGFDCTLARDAQLADRLYDPVGLLWDRARLARQRGSGGEFGVERIALAKTPARVRAGLVDL